MKHFDFDPSKLQVLPYYSGLYNAKIYAKRDDLSFMECGGGNKARMLQYILYDLSPEKYDVLVTAGGPCSNFNRACALMCSRLGVKFHLVEYTDNPEDYRKSLNYRICKVAGMTTTRCEKLKVAHTINRVLEEYRDKGVRTKFIYGGGKSLEGIYSYYEAIEELANQISTIEHLFVACGTGTTLTGICAGMKKFFPNATVHAISTARSWKTESITLEEDIRILNAYLNSTYSFDNLEYYEEFLCGGYGQYNGKIKTVIKECVANENMFIDPTYSGKAFYGMLEILNNSENLKGKNIVFWNTGGVFNFLSELSSW